jgi:hypothetical protein
MELGWPRRYRRQEPAGGRRADGLNWPIQLNFWKTRVPWTPKDFANRIAARRKPTDGFRRETFALPLDEARARARSILKRYPKAAYMTEVESWRDLGDGRIEFTMKRLPTAD